MLIQPFIENAIKHGIKPRQGKGHVFINFKLVGSKLICEIDDDGVGRENMSGAEDELGKHKSLATTIIRERIKVLNKKLHQKISLEIIDKISDTGQSLGTLVRLNLPYLLD
jgi:LytS/YehU family sensor histidine kinase